MPKQEHAHVTHEVAIAEDVVSKVARHPTPGEHPDRTAEGLRWVAGVLDGFPGGHQEVPVLGVHDGSFLRRQAEEVGIEVEHAVEHGSRLHVARAPHHVRPHTSFDQLLLVDRPDTLHPSTQIRPVRRRVERSGEVCCHTDDGNVILGHVNPTFLGPPVGGASSSLASTSPRGHQWHGSTRTASPRTENSITVAGSSRFDASLEALARDVENASETLLERDRGLPSEQFFHIGDIGVARVHSDRLVLERLDLRLVSR